MYIIRSVTILLLLIFAESAVGFVQGEEMAVGIVLIVQPYCHFKSCAKDIALYKEQPKFDSAKTKSSLTGGRI